MDIENNNEIETPITEAPEVIEQTLVDKLTEEAVSAGENEEFHMELEFADKKIQEDLAWQERTGLNSDTLCGAIETIVFLSDRPITVNKIRDNIDKEMPLRVIHESLKRLQSEYEQKHHGIRLFELGEGYQFKTKSTYSKYVQDLFKASSIVLSSTALEVLAIIAYKQPTTRVEVEKIRGVDSSHIIRNLLDKRLIKIEGRSDEIGKPSTYVTTVEFLEMFNLQTLEDLPSEIELESIADHKEVGEIKDIKKLVEATTETKEKFNQDELDEVDKLAEEIKAIPSETDFTTSWKSEDKKKKDPETAEEAKSAFDLLEEFVFSEDNENIDGIDGIQEDTITEENRQTIQDLKEMKVEFTTDETLKEAEAVLDTVEIQNIIEAVEENDAEEVSEVIEAVADAVEALDMDSIKEESEVDANEAETIHEIEKGEIELALDKAFDKLMADPDPILTQGAEEESTDSNQENKPEHLQ